MEILAPTTEAPAVTEAGLALEVVFEASQAWPYAVDVRGDGGDWEALEGQEAEGTAQTGENAVEVTVPEESEAGDYDLRVRLFTPQRSRVQRASDIAERAIEVVEPAEPPTTGFEDRGGDGWTTYSEELAFLAELAETSDRVTLSEVGESVEGRPLHLVRVGHPAPPSDDEIAEGSSVLVIGSQHGNEPAGREMALQLSRDLAFTDDAELLEQLSDTTMLFIPTANPDGREANTRTNGEGTDTNRDHLHLETPEGRAMAQVLRDFTPQITVDTHERPSGSNPDMELLWPRNLNVDEELRELNVEMVEDYLFPGVEDAGFSTGVYGSPGGAGGKDERISRNVIGLRHGMALLTESGGQDPPVYRVDAQRAVMDELLAFHRERAGDVLEVVAGAPERREVDGQAREPFYLDGADNWPPEVDDILDPAPCGYLLNTVQSETVDRHAELFPFAREEVGEHGVFVTMAQPMMTVVPLLLDERADFNLVEGRALDDCSDPGSEEPPELPPDPSPPAQFATDFSDDTVGEPPAGWSTLWNDSDWTVLDDPRRLQHEVDDEGGRRALTWDEVGDDGHVQGDVEISAVVRGREAGATLFQVGFHASGDAGSENAYYLDARMPGASQENQVRINRYRDGGYSRLGNTELPFTVEEDTWYRVVLQREGDALRAKMWRDGEAEPDTWQVTVTDASFDGGRAGVWHFTSDTVNDWAHVGVGTGGEPAPRAPADIVS